MSEPGQHPGRAGEVEMSGVLGQLERLMRAYNDLAGKGRSNAAQEGTGLDLFGLDLMKKVPLLIRPDRREATVAPCRGVADRRKESGVARVGLTVVEPGLDVVTVKLGMDVPVIEPGAEVQQLVPHLEVPEVEPGMDVPIDEPRMEMPIPERRAEVSTAKLRRNMADADRKTNGSIELEIEGTVESVGYPVTRLPTGDIEFRRIGAVLGDDSEDAAGDAEEMPMERWDQERPDTRTELVTKLQHLDKGQRSRVGEILHRFGEVFDKPDRDGCRLGVEHVIDTGQAEPVHGAAPSKCNRVDPTQRWSSLSRVAHLNGGKKDSQEVLGSGMETASGPDKFGDEARGSTEREIGCI
ncbi:hypothetical protein GE061_012900 [Apolygus lucorum]|uniref:Uncharacterized protein n=1 Tax=Apolygus lucorum TaxID=248454 RepID=A0A8S9XVT4_APOLU|nr:hypothetical protein GE061_012900 [Apolygus lucorum]